MKHIVLFGAGKSATILIRFLIDQLESNDWQLTVCDNNLSLIESKLNNTPRTSPLVIDAKDGDARVEIIKTADVVISLLPPSMHYQLALDCIRQEKHLFTASYVDEEMADLKPAIEDKNLLFLCEMGLDPGMDHMSAMRLVDNIWAEGGVITSFRSHCGGLVAPESDDNPWHYKISWNPRNVVMAGKAGAKYLQNGKAIQENYAELFDPNRVVDIPGVGYLSYYPNRDSIPYIDLYKVYAAKDFVRTTLRYPEFCFGWKNLIDLKLTDETIRYQTNGMTLQQFFQEHFNNHGFSEWIEKQLTARFEQTRELLMKLQELLEAEEVADPEAKNALQDFMMVDNQGDLKNISLEDVKTKAAATVAGQMHEANLSMKQLFFLGMDDNETVIDKGECSAADVLQFAMERKLKLEDSDKDMVVMLHEIEFEKGDEKYRVDSYLVVKGEDHMNTAMAKTVGLPLGIAASLLLKGRLKVRGLHIPIIPEIYDPVLQELENHDIIFRETVKGL
jgi:saccharopine dehydrogenase-like NADP-dependent oxidoreductase